MAQKRKEGSELTLIGKCWNLTMEWKFVTTLKERVRHNGIVLLIRVDAPGGHVEELENSDVLTCTEQ